MRKYALGLYEKAMPDIPWPEKLQAAKAAGYDYLEMSIDATEEKIARLDWSRAEQIRLLRWADEVQLPIRSLCVSALTKYALGDPNPELRTRGMRIAEKSLALADALGARIVMLPGYDIYYGESTEETKRLYLEAMERLAELAARSGVMLGFETMENEFMNTVGKAMKYVSLLDSPYVKIYPDIGNLTNAAHLYRQDVLEDMSLGEGQLLAMHLKETRPGVFREVPFGSGHVAFESAIRMAWSLGVRRFVTEFWYREGTDWQGELHKAHDRFAFILDKIA